MICKNRTLKILIAAVLSFSLAVSPVFAAEEMAGEDIQEQTEVIEEDMSFLYIESKELQAPGEQNIAVAWKDEIRTAENIALSCKTESGNSVLIPESERTDESVRFTKTFAAADAGKYTIEGIRYQVGEEENFFTFNDVNIDATFTVVRPAVEVTPIEIEDGDLSGVSENVEAVLAEADSEAASDVQVCQVKKSSYVVVLDPGHSGSDSGAINTSLGSGYYNERDLNYKIAEYCRDELSQYNDVTVYMSYPKGGSTDIDKRVKTAAGYKADLMVSLHLNAIDKSTRGGEVWYPNTTGGKDTFHADGADLSKKILSQLAALGINNRGIKTRNSSDHPGKDYYGIIRGARANGFLGIIVEHCFIDNNSDAKAFLSSDAKLKNIGVADATGIASYLGLSKLKFITDENGARVAVDKDGNIITSKWVKISGYTYCLDGEGHPRTGMQIIGNGRYYLGTDGIARQNIWVNVSGGRYYLLANGRVATGVRTIGGYRYGFAGNGMMLRNCAKWLGNGYYTFDSAGRSYIYKSKTKRKSAYYAKAGSVKKGTLKKNRSFYVLRTSGKWSQMSNGYWIKTSYTKKTAVYPVMKPSVNTKFRAKLKKKSSSRSGPSTAYIKTKTFKKNRKVTVIGTYGSWAKVSSGQWLPTSRLKKY